jgi:mono/diheme cytochrome c family protein
MSMQTLVAAVAWAGTLSAQNPDRLPADQPARTGFYTEAQARRGEEAFRRHCAECHAPAVHSSQAFRQAWAGLSVFDLYELIRTTMPNDNPGRLSRTEYAEIVAYLLRLNGVAAGNHPLPTDESVLRSLRLDFPPPAPSRQ